MENLNIRLSIQEANTILSALGQMPYLRVAQLIESIRAQADGQLNAPSAITPESDELTHNTADAQKEAVA
ncbi:MAG: hypothetical protein AAF570_17690 [Bacteroidota bacterium]